MPSSWGSSQPRVQTWVSCIAGRFFNHLATRKDRSAGPGSIPGLRRSPGEGNGSLLQYSCLENSMDRGAWWATVHGVTMSETQLRTNTFTFHFPRNTA